MDDSETINGGYVVLARRATLDSQLWQCGPDVVRVATYLILRARYHQEPKKYPGFKVSRGDVLTSLSSISEDCSWFENRMVRKWSRGKVGRILETLEKIGFCSRISDTYGTHLNICKYDLYQDLSKYKSDSDGTTPEQHRTPMDHNNKKVQEGCKKEKKGKDTHFCAQVFLSKAGVEKQLAEDWLKVRKTKRLADTETALAAILKEIEKTNRPINEIFKICCVKSWGGFKDSWPWREEIKQSTHEEDQKCLGCQYLPNCAPAKTEGSRACANYS